MNKTPLAVFSGLVVAAAAAAGYFAYDHPNAPAIPAAVNTPPPPVVQVEPTPSPQVATVEPAKETPKAQEAVVPSFDTARVDAGGSAVVAGRALPGADVKLTFNGDVVATSKANDAGEFVMVPDKPLPVGQGSLALEATLDGKTTPSAQSFAVAAKAVASAVAPVKVTSAQPPKVPDVPTKTAAAELPKPLPGAAAVDGIDYDAAGNIQFSGHAHPGNAVDLFVDNKPLSDVKTDGQGRWSYQDSSTIAAGTHDLRADEKDTAGNVVARVTLPFKREDQAKVANAEAPPQDASQPATAAVRPNSVTIQPGNNLWRLSRDVYGAGKDYRLIYQANRQQIKNPRLIYPGQILATPEKTAN